MLDVCAIVALIYRMDVKFTSWRIVKNKLYHDFDKWTIFS